MRHILDVFDCILKCLKTNHVNFSKRERNEFIELNINLCLVYFNETIKNLNQLDIDFNKLIKVTDDLGTSKITQDYTVGSTLILAHSHALHHYASLSYLIHQLDIKLLNDDFGYNPTTPRVKTLVK